jgi:hypothetical protein
MEHNAPLVFYCRSCKSLQEMTMLDDSVMNPGILESYTDQLWHLGDGFRVSPDSWIFPRFRSCNECGEEFTCWEIDENLLEDLKGYIANKDALEMAYAELENLVSELRSSFKQLKVTEARVSRLIKARK